MNSEKLFYMPIEDVFNITGRGVVVTGRILLGSVEVYDELEVVPYGPGEIKTAEATGMEMGRKLIDSAETGDNVGILLRGLNVKDVKRGYVLASPYLVQPQSSIEAEIYFRTRKEGGRETPVHNHYRPHIRFGALDITCEITLPEGIEAAWPGDNIENISINLINPCPVLIGQTFQIRESCKIVAEGIVTDLFS